ncbi:transketolase [compost metagenome]
MQNVKSLTNIPEKIKSFGLNVIEINGHDVSQIILAIDKAKSSDVPCCIIAKTIKGKGISFMEDKAEWHGKAVNDEEYSLAISELK